MRARLRFFGGQKRETLLQWRQDLTKSVRERGKRHGLFAYLENPDLLHEGTEPNRAYYIPYGERMPAAPADRKDSDRVVWLSGEWGFRYYESLAALEEAALLREEDLVPMEVPSVWQTHGYDAHQYTNGALPHPLRPALCAPGEPLRPVCAQGFARPGRAGELVPEL